MQQEQLDLPERNGVRRRHGTAGRRIEVEAGRLGLGTGYDFRVDRTGADPVQPLRDPGLSVRANDLVPRASLL
jgi:hypothetical protein